MVTFQSADTFIFRFYFLSFILIIFPINFISFNENLILLLLSLELWQQDSILSLLCQFLFPMLFNCILVNFLSPDSEWASWRSSLLEYTIVVLTWKQASHFLIYFLLGKYILSYFGDRCVSCETPSKTLWSSLVFTPSTPAFTVVYLQWFPLVEG